MAKAKIYEKQIYEYICKKIDELVKLVEGTKQAKKRFDKLPQREEDIAKKGVRMFTSPNIDKIRKLKEELTKYLEKEGVQSKELVKKMNETINGYGYLHEYTEGKLEEMIKELKEGAKTVATTIGSDPDLISKPDWEK